MNSNDLQLTVLTSSLLARAAGVSHFFTERGEASADPYACFNICDYTGDAPEHVAACRRLLAARLGIVAEAIVVPRQVHGTTVAEVTAPGWRGEADAVMTDRAGLCLTVSTADCVPLLLFDEEHLAVAAVHAGWRGMAAHIVRLTVEAMIARYATRPERLAVAVGPSISLASFEVGREVGEAFLQAGFPASVVVTSPEDAARGKAHVDLWGCAVAELTAVGVLPSRIDVTGVCTYLHPDRFFSARRLGIASGRISSGIMIDSSL
jgi:YfiH family protein